MTNIKNDRAKILEHLQEIARDEGIDVSELAANVSSQMDTLKDKARDRLGEVASQVDESARSMPWYFIGGAAALGYLAGRSLFNGKR